LYNENITDHEIKGINEVSLFCCVVSSNTQKDRGESIHPGNIWIMIYHSASLVQLQCRSILCFSIYTGTYAFISSLCSIS